MKVAGCVQQAFSGRCVVKQAFSDALSSESRQDFRQLRVTETPGEFRYPGILL